MKFERKNRFLSFKELLPELIEKLNLKTEFSIEKIKKEWASIVGPIIAPHSFPQFIDENKTLHIYSDHSVYSNDLFMRKKYIVGKINSIFSNSPVLYIRINTERRRWCFFI